MTVRQVYFAECIGPTGEPIGAYKIGCSYDWPDRIKQIEAGAPFTLDVKATVTGSLVLEKICHIALAEHRIAGEYFHASERVLRVVKYAERSGRAFSFIEDLGEADTPDGSVQAFMTYHGVSLAEVCEVLGYKASQYEKRLADRKYRNRNMVAAAAVVASRRGQYVRWPMDAVRGLLGEVSRQIAEANAEKAAA